MARRRPARRSAGGGGGIQAARAARTRVTLATLSALAYAVAPVYAAVHEPRVAAPVAVVGVVGALMLAVLLVRALESFLMPALACAVVVYVVALLVHGSGVDDGAPLVGACLLISGELAVWSLDARHRIAVERPVVVDRAVALVVLVLAGLAASGLVIAVSASSLGGGLAWTVLGSLAAVLAVGVAARLAR